MAAFQTPSFVALVMDLCVCGDLSRFALEPDCRLDAEAVLFVGIEVVAVMSWLHSKRVLFRDLKAENVMLDSEGHVRLIDFGTAVMSDDADSGGPQSSGIAGTACYWAPEFMAHYLWREAQKTGPSKETKPGMFGSWAGAAGSGQPPPYTQSVDWWAVGVLLYELTEQELPYGLVPEFVMPTEVGRAEPYRQPTATHGTSELHDFFERVFVYHPSNRLGSAERCGADIKAHRIFEGVDWELVEQRRLPSPLTDLLRVSPQGGGSNTEETASKEEAGIKIAMKMEAKDEVSIQSGQTDSNTIDGWDYVSPEAITREYLEQVALCVSAV